MEEKPKPKEILELEKIYGITLEEQIDSKKIEINHFKLDKNENVIQIDLLGNNLKNIKGFDNFKYLQILDLSGTYLTKIENLDNLKNLKELFLGSNNIKKIENLDNLKNLEVLFLYDNDIEDIKDIKKLINPIFFPKLKHLVIDENPFEKKLKNIKLNKGDSLEILRNYFKLEDAKKKIEIKAIPKIMLVGNHNSGKSTFLNYFFSNNFNDRSQSTHILNIQKYEKNNITKAIFYDFGGQDYYHGIYKAFMTNEALNLIFWKEDSNNNNLGDDTTGGFTQNFNREYWIKQVQHFGDKNITWLIQTFLDENKRKALTNDELQEVIDDEYHVILKSPIKPNLKALKENLNLFIEKSSNISISKNYHEFINTHITNATSHNYVNVEELEKEFINSEKINFKEQLSQLCLQGVILYYKNIPALENVVWLNPQATVEHIHKEVFEKGKMRKFKGIVPKDDFEKICPDEKIRLMLKENKVIYFDEVEENYIIPSYLPIANKEGEEFFYFSIFSKASLTLKFEYFIPFGFINQLICHYGDIKEKKRYWRDMLLFTVDGRDTQVLIKLDFETLTIELFVSNKDDSTREKEVIKTIFDDICAFYVNNENHRSKLLPEIEEMEKDKFKHLIPINYPDELYISLDNKYFVNFNILDDETKTKESILAYEIEDFRINKTNAKSLFTRNFAYLSTNNKGLNKMKKIFVSYSRKDADYRDALRQHLNMLTIFDIADNWACEDITIGKWDEQIQKELLDSDIIIYMLSANFFSSSYIREKEVLEVMKQMKENPNKKILPIIVSEFVGLDNLKRLIQNPTDIQTAMLDISSHQFLPYGNVWNHLTNQNEEKIISLEEHRKNQSLNSALKQICDEILKVI
ncbi:TIR domain-containing protein [Aliarcobacter butzleri]|uniref:TIR domain-containing protein n=1 Tax=Aliarcobacter butzleri TaxID=28197 RepID=UPI00263E1F1E|nr:TIR domain-containing protein [Aliarcobacter butzleri]MDN5104782.1 TIR domain-containing protein [Aliarcobacter butzleri]